VVYINLYSRLVRKSFPSKVTNLVGIVSQFQGVYQILPRDISDFKDYTSTKYQLNSDIGNVLVFPNPANDILNIQCEKTICSLKITNLSGQVVLFQKQDQKQIQIQNLTSGVYILEATFENGTITRTKFCKF